MQLLRELGKGEGRCCWPGPGSALGCWFCFSQVRAPGPTRPSVTVLPRYLRRNRPSVQAHALSVHTVYINIYIAQYRCYVQCMSISTYNTGIYMCTRDVLGARGHVVLLGFQGGHTHRAGVGETWTGKSLERRGPPNQGLARTGRGRGFTVPDPSPTPILEPANNVHVLVVLCKMN